MEIWFWLAVVGYLFYAISSLIDKYLMNIRLGPVQTDMFKMLFDGLVVLTIGMIFFGIAITPRLALWSLLLGVLYASAGILYYKVLQKRDVEEVVPYLQSAAILFLFITSAALFRESVTFTQIFGVFLIIAGVWSILAGGFSIPKIDRTIWLVLVIVVIAGAYALLVKKLLFDVRPVDLAITMYFSAAFAIAVYQAVRGRWEKFKVDKRTPRIFFGAVFGGLGTLILYSALALGDASRIYPMSGLESVFVFVLAALFLKEKFSWSRLVGVVLVCSGIVLVPI